MIASLGSVTLLDVASVDDAFIWRHISRRYVIHDSTTPAPLRAS